MKIERSIRPISRSATDSPFWRGVAAIFLRITEGGMSPAATEAPRRSTSSQCGSILPMLIVPPISTSSGS